MLRYGGTKKGASHASSAQTRFAGHGLIWGVGKEKREISVGRFCSALSATKSIKATFYKYVRNYSGN
jgi:hypothetical protein